MAQLHFPRPSPFKHTESFDTAHVFQWPKSRYNQEAVIANWAKEDKEECRRYRLPAHWEIPQGEGLFVRLLGVIFFALSVTSFGHPSLQPVWAAIKLDEDDQPNVWDTGSQKVCDRLET